MQHQLTKEVKTSDDLAGGVGGNLLLTAQSLMVSGGGLISTRTAGSGDGGTLSLKVSGPVSIDGSGATGMETGIAADTTFAGRGGNGGQIQLNLGGPFSLTNGSTISATTSGSGAGGTVSIQPLAVGDPLAVSVASNSTISAATSGTGLGGGLSIAADSLALSGGSMLVASTTGSGSAGSVTLNLTAALTVDGNGSLIGADAGVGSTGNGGSISITSGSVLITNGALLTASTFASGSGGEITLSTNSLTLADASGIQSSSTGSGDAGGVTVAVNGPVTISTGGFISSSSAISNAGGVSVAATGNYATLTLTNGSVLAAAGESAGDINLSADFGITTNDNSNISAQTQGLTANATAGDITLKTFGALAMNQSTISAKSQLTFGGDVNITAGGELDLTQSTISARAPYAGQVMITTPSLMLSEGSSIATDTALAQAGISTTDITLHVGLLGLNASSITASTDATGPGGTITIDSQTVGGKAPLVTLEDDSSISANTSGSGRGGDLVFTLASLSLDGASTLSASNVASGNPGDNGLAGSITLKVESKGQLNLNNNSSISTSGGVAADAGSVQITAGTVNLRDHSTIESQSASGVAGQVMITSIDSMLFYSSEVSTSSTFNVAGELDLKSGRDISFVHSLVQDTAGLSGGAITLNAPNLVYLSASTITAYAGLALPKHSKTKIDGGRISIDPQLVVLSDGSKIDGRANGVEERVKINSPALLLSSTSVVETDAPRDFTVNNALASAIARLSGAVATTGVTLADHCGVNFANDNVSSFLVTGRGGTPVEPGGWLPSFDWSDGSTTDDTTQKRSHSDNGQ